MLYEMDNKLLIINKTLQDLLIAVVSYMNMKLILVDQMQNRMNRMYSSIYDCNSILIPYMNL